ncbi:MAG: 4-(cytidine 5'-diphospho)-2-C-methyl-D-erythritol kinase [Acidobacteriia bacterium]|nr:4-(cytidine 5'-diphospho)-2-C-methyl-D-erythritol kinase [Terriglobia bacterium]
MTTAIRVRAFAKINLGLKILARRPDGYHEIRTLYQAVSLADCLEILLSSRGRGIHLECDDPAIPAGRANLVCQAGALWKRARQFRGGIEIRLSKRIPAGSGLGGASSDAAATLLGLERLTGDRLGLAERFRLASRLGSDVPFFLWGGRALGIGRGEEVYPLWDLPRRHCLIVFPGFAVSTQEAYGELDRRRRLTESPRNPRIALFGARSHFSLEDWGPAENDFEQVVFARWPKLARMKRQLIRAGAETASLTGSGSAVFALFRSARTLARAASLIPRGWKQYPTRTLSRLEYLTAVTSEK